MAKETKAAPGIPETYGAVVERLESVVKKLENGELSLEDSLLEFEDGIRLVRRGEKLLADAEHRVEQLLNEGGVDTAVPLDVKADSPAPERVGPVRTPSTAPVKSGDEDVPF